jgi:hypothetical protein
MTNPIIKPIYIYIKDPNKIFGPVEYFIVNDLTRSGQFVSFHTNSNAFIIRIQDSITNLVLPYSYHNHIYVSSLSLITFTELLNLMQDINEEYSESKYEIIQLLQLVIANWEDWY